MQYPDCSRYLSNEEEHECVVAFHVAKRQVRPSPRCVSRELQSFMMLLFYVLLATILSVQAEVLLLLVDEEERIASTHSTSLLLILPFSAAGCPRAFGGTSELDLIVPTTLIDTETNK